MPRYLIERRFPGAGGLSARELQDIARKIRAVLNQLGPEIKWIETLVADDRLYCLYEAPNEDWIVNHSLLCGLPARRIREIKSRVNLATAQTMLAPAPENPLPSS